MAFKYDSRGVEVKGPVVKLLPDQRWYKFKITETEEQVSQKGNPMVKCVCQVVNEPEYLGHELWHWVTFLDKEAKGAGIAINFLSAIGEPHDGVFDVDSDDWVGKRFEGWVITDEYNGKKNNKINMVRPVEKKEAVVSGKAAAQEDDDGVPF